MEIVFVCVSVHPTTMSFDTLWWLLFGQSDTHFQFASPNTNLEKSGNEGHSDNRLRADGISNEGQFILFEIYSDVVPLAIIILSPLHIFAGHLICTVNEDLKDTVVQWRMVNIVVAFPCKSCQCQAIGWQLFILAPPLHSMKGNGQLISSHVHQIRLCRLSCEGRRKLKILVVNL